MAENNFKKNNQTSNKLLNMPDRHQNHPTPYEEELENDPEEIPSEEVNEDEEDLAVNEEDFEDNPFDQNFDSIPDESAPEEANNTTEKTPKRKKEVKEKQSKKSIKEKASNVKNKTEKTIRNIEKNVEKTIKVIKKIGSFLLKHPVVGLFILAFLLVLILAVLIALNLFDTNSNKGSEIAGVTGSSCSYSINGEIISNIQVEIINCEATKDNYQVIETVPFEKYVAGVALAEMGEAYEEEAMKAQLIAVRSYTLSRNKESDVSGYNKKDKVIRMRNCEWDQVYWDYTADSYRQANTVSVDPSVSLYSPEYKKTSDFETAWKTALSEEAKTKYEGIVSTVLGKYAVDNSDNTVYTSYVDTTSAKFTQLAKENVGTANGSYTAILMQVYPQIANFKSPECAFTYFGAGGEYSTWKQYCSLGATEWCNERLGLGSGTTIDQIGCLLVSISMQIAHSKAAVTIENFNPGTFAKAIKYWGAFNSKGSLENYAAITSVVPGFKKLDSVPLTGSKASKINTIKSYAEQGYYIVIQAKSGEQGDTHFVALDVASSAATNWTTIKIWNPSKMGTDLFEDYGYKSTWITRMTLFQIN